MQLNRLLSSRVPISAGSVVRRSCRGIINERGTKLYFSSYTGLQKSNNRGSGNGGFTSTVLPPPGSLPRRDSGKSSDDIPLGGGKWARRIVIGGTAFIVLYGYDKIFHASAFARSFRCVYDLLVVGLDYKLNFSEGKDIEALHERCAERIYNLMIHNKGLYIKMGQAVAIQSGIFPEIYQDKFAKLFDAAPQDSWAQVENLLHEEYKEPPDQFFEKIEHRAIASASIAQVHHATLKTGESVAVKVQHADLSKQVWWDLTAFRWIMWVYERYLFHVPIYFAVEHIVDRLTREVNFTYEVDNSERLKKFIENEPSLSDDDIHIPYVFPEFCTDRVIVSEWIDGVSLNRTKDLEKQGYDTDKAIKTLMNLYGLQMFQWGHVHCDPHPGNIILRKLPNKKQQTVLVDHGLYIDETEKFRKQYGTLWESAFLGRNEELTKITEDWGFGDSEITSSMVVQSFHTSGRKGMQRGHHYGPQPLPATEPDPHEEFKRQQEIKDRFQNFFKDTTRIPLELIFLGRTMRILQGLNKRFKSPVNRIKVFARAATSALDKDRYPTWSSQIWKIRDTMILWVVITLSDLGFFLIRLRQSLFSGIGLGGKGVEDLLEDQIKQSAEEMGIDIDLEALEDDF